MTPLAGFITGPLPAGPITVTLLAGFITGPLPAGSITGTLKARSVMTGLSGRWTGRIDTVERIDSAAMLLSSPMPGGKIERRGERGGLIEDAPDGRRGEWQKVQSDVVTAF